MNQPEKMAPGKVAVLTGGIACGKSTVAQFLEEAGVPVLDTDHVGHQVLRKGEEGYTQVVNAFGPKILDADSEIDRGILGPIVFSDPAQRKRLNAMVHPLIAARWRAWADLQREQSGCAVVIIPLYYEVAIKYPFDAEICVACDSDTMQKRLQLRGHSELEAHQRIASQWPLERKIERADFTIWNTGSLADLKRETLNVLQQIA